MQENYLWETMNIQDFLQGLLRRSFLLPYTHPTLYPKSIVNEIQTTVKPNKLYVMTVYRHDLHNGVKASCHNLVKVQSTEFLWHG